MSIVKRVLGTEFVARSCFSLMLVVVIPLVGAMRSSTPMDDHRDGKQSCKAHLQISPVHSIRVRAVPPVDMWRLVLADAKSHRAGTVAFDERIGGNDGQYAALLQLHAASKSLDLLALRVKLQV
jgi:hypothetical protein